VLFLLILHSKYSAAILSKIHSYRLLLWFAFLIKRFFFLQLMVRVEECQRLADQYSKLGL